MGVHLACLPALLLLCLACSGVAIKQCYTCSYVYSGTDGSTNRECVTAPVNHTLTSVVNCPIPKLCTVKVTYDPGYARLLSLSRDCLERDTEPDGCQDNVLRPSCVERCAENLCNDGDGDIYRKLFPSGPSNPSSPLQSAPVLIVAAAATTFSARIMQTLSPWTVLSTVM